MVIGIPTSKSHDRAIDALLNEFNAILVNGERVARETRIAMAAGAVTDLVIRDMWDKFARHEDRINQIRRIPDFHDQYARFRGLSYNFNSTDDVQAALDQIRNLPDNHKFKTDHRVDFKINEGSLPGGLAENTNYFVRTISSNALTLTTSEGGGSDIDLTNGVGTAEMLLNIKPDLGALRTSLGDIITEIETNLIQRSTTYDRPNLEHIYSTRSSGETAALQADLATFEALIDVIAA